MRFSVAIPAYKAEYLGEAVSSVFAQTCPDWELVIVDDHSPEDLMAVTAPYLADPRVRYFRNERNIGAVDVVDNWNRCLEYCTGDYVICIGDDDRLLPHCLEDLRAVITRHPGLGLYHIQAEMIDAEGTVIESFPPRPSLESRYDLLERRWKKNSRQFIGDFCFDLPRLRATGGFFKLPLAWWSDDISAFQAAADGIANTDRPGFQYRQSPLSLSSDEDFTVKVDATVHAAGWFKSALDAMQPATPEEAAQKRRLEAARSAFFPYLCGEYLKTDIGKHPRRLSYWLRHRKGTLLTGTAIVRWGIKGILLNRLVKR